MQAVVAEILAAWRRAERLTGELPPGPERDAALHACERLQDLYRDLTGDSDASRVSEAEARALADEALRSVGAAKPSQG